ncbi:MAG: phosphopantetheine-binding protein [Planctomycetota bacterium]
MSSPKSIDDRFDELTASQQRWLMERLITYDDGSLFQEAENQPTELAAWIVRDEDEISEVVLDAEMQKKLPPSLIPKHFGFVDEIPKTSSGKVNRASLSKSVLQSLRDTLNRSEEKNENAAVLSSQSLGESETILVRICQQIRNLDAISPNERFVDLGIDSFASIQLIALARKEGLEIEPRDVIEFETISELAKAADSRRTGFHQQSREPQSIEPRLPVVSKIRCGSKSPGGSVLMIHEVGGRCGYAKHLAADLLPTESLYVTQQPQHSESPTSIKALAELYSGEWLQAEPGGRKTIVTFCWGGPLAFELAGRLHADGHSDLRLLVIESGTEASYEHASSVNRFIDRQKGNLIRIKSRASSLSSMESVIALGRTIFSKLSGQRNIVTADSDFKFRDEEGDPNQIKANVQAFLDYQPKPSSLAMDLFRVRGPAGLIGLRYSNYTLGWRYVLAGSRLRTHSIAGDHNTCVSPPHAASLVSSMNDAWQDR